MDVISSIRQGLHAVEDVVVRDVPRVVFDVQRRVVVAIRQHLHQLDPPPDPLTAGLSSRQGDELPSPTEIFQSLLDRSIYNMPDDSRNDLYRAVMQALVPDEARILAALSDGSTYPLVHIAEPTTGVSSTTVLANASTIGRVAGVSLPDYTPLYLTRMLQLGLVAEGPEGSSSMDDDYAMLLTDAAVNAAQAKARRGIRGARVIRRTVRITALGQELWEAAK